MDGAPTQPGPMRADRPGDAIRCVDVRKSFGQGTRTVVAVDRLTFSVARSELVCLVGPTGCGKTTALKMLAGLADADSGRIEIGLHSDGSRLRAATVFQEHGLFPWMTVLDNVAFGLEASGVGRDERRERSADLVESMGLRDFAGSLPHQLSVGMRQRVGVARALATRPDILFMDEPFGSLDAQTRRVLQQEIESVWLRARPTVLFVTPDIEEAIRLGDRVLVMSARPGRVVEEVDVPIERPRDGDRGRRAAMVELEDHLWQLLERPAVRALGMEPRT